MPRPFVVSIPRSSREEHRAHIDALFAWYARNAAAVTSRWVLDANRLMILAEPTALDDLPPFATFEPYPATPRWGIVADVRDATYDHRGETIHGTLHFAPGATLYVYPRFSGDGWERAHQVGLDRETHRYTTVIGPTDRLERWRVETLEHPPLLWTLEHPRHGARRPWHEEWSRTDAEKLAAGMNDRGSRRAR